MYIPYEKHTLANGLEVILHEDHSDPIVAVFVYYHVGSSREERGLTGFAHLFEHMLFQGSQNVGDDQHFKLIQEAGGTLNGTTNQDRTNYFETLPANQLELALWLESDRMGFLLPAMRQDKLDNQRDVVMNERRQSYENRPYGLVYETVLKHLYDDGHPYSWPTIGSMDDIAAASLEDIDVFFRRWYGPNNATLAIGGDIDPAEALALVEKYFGAIPRGPAVDKPRPFPADLAQTRRVVLEDRIQLPQLTLVWPTVEAWHPHEARINLLADVLAANKSSILDHVLMIQEELASVVTVGHRIGERAGSLQVNLRPNPGVSLGRLEERLNELVAGVVREGVDPERLERLKNRREGGLIRRLETVSGRMTRLAHDNCFTGDPERVREELANHRAVTADEVTEAARMYLHEAPRIVLSAVPEGRRELAATDRPLEVRAPRVDIDRSGQPAAGAVHAFRTPEVWHAVLANGVRVTGAPFAKVPLARLSLSVPAGHLAESRDTLGLAHLTAKMLEEGTRDLSGSELTDALDGMGGEYSVASTDDEIVLRMSVLSDHTSEAAGLLAGIVLEPRFSDDDFARVQRQQLVDIDTRSDQIRTIASDAFARRVHEEELKGQPDIGTRATVERLSVDDVRAFWKEHAVPGAARLCFVGAHGKRDVVLLFEELATKWKPGPEATPAIPAAGSPADGRALPERTTIYLVDKPGAKQSELRIGHRGVALSDPDYYPLLAMNYSLGGSFSSRINLNLREDKGYTYGARSLFNGGLTPGAFLVSTGVKTQDTAPAVGETLKELAGIVQGITEDELEFTRQALSQALGRTFESARARLTLIENIAKYGWADDYPEQRLAWLGDMTADVLTALARRHVHPERLVVLVVGDRSEVLPGLVGLGLGEVVELDLAGEVVATAPAPG